MFRSLLAAVLSATLALPALTVPAAAHQTNYAHRHERGNGAGTAAAVLGGLTALYLLKRHSDRRDDKQRTTPQPRRMANVLPDRCFRQFETRRGAVRGYGARCLHRSVANPHLLPPTCINQVRTTRGTRNLYRARCLRQQGWTARSARH